MNKYIIALCLSFVSFFTFSQEMSTTKLGAIFKKVSDNFKENKTRWDFIVNEVAFIAIADSTHNRMRIISPIIEVSKLSEELKTASLMANFHTALDIKYAITNDVLWSVFIHPLKELSEKQVIDAISQVYYGNVNFGSTFSSTSLVFPGRQKENNPNENNKQEKIKLLEKI